jgi:hypothetical protein
MKNDVFAKGIYSHPQISDFISAKQYMIISKDDKKYLSVRFSNDSSFTVSAICLNIYQLDARGNVLQKNTVEQNSMHELPGSLFTLASVVEADAKCSDVKVQIIYADSGEYRYSPRKNRVTVSFMPKEERQMHEDLCRRHGEVKNPARIFYVWVVILLVAMILINLFQIMMPFVLESMGATQNGGSLEGEICDRYGEDSL